MKRIDRAFALLFAAICVTVTPARAAGVWTSVTNPDVGGPLSPRLAGKPLVVRIHADWCGECQTSLPDFQAFLQTVRGKVNVVDIDVTSAKTARESQERATQLGLRGYFERTKNAPLTVAFINPKSHMLYAALRGNVDLRDLLKAETGVERSMRGR